MLHTLISYISVPSLSNLFAIKRRYSVGSTEAKNMPLKEGDSVLNGIAHILIFTTRNQEHK